MRESICHRHPRAAIVIPAKAGIHLQPISVVLALDLKTDSMDSRFRGNDESESAFGGDDEFSRGLPLSLQTYFLPRSRRLVDRENDLE